MPTSETAAAPAPTISRRADWTSRSALAVFALCLLAFPILRYEFLRANSFTFDELLHIQAGYRYWQCGEFANNPEHPPLVKFLATAPIRNWQINGYPSACGTKVVPSRSVDTDIASAIYHSPNASSILWKSRSVLILFPLLMLVSLFFATRRWFGDVAAAIAVLLATLEPTLVAHGSLVTTDMALSATMFLTIALGIEYVRRPRWWVGLACGVALGMALASKHSAIVLPVLLLLTMWLSLLARHSSRQKWLQASIVWVAACVIGFTLLWSSYGFRYSALPHASEPAYNVHEILEKKGMQSRVSSHVVLFANHHHLLPEAYLAGLADVLTRSEVPTYLFGRFYATGLWYYFPVALAIKLTLGVLLLAVATVLTPRVWRKHHVDLIPIVFAPLAFLCLAMLSKMNIGVRHVLPVIPFLAVIASVGAAELFAGSRRLAVAVSVLIALSVFSSLRAAPLQLSYANEVFGGSNNTYRLLGDSNVDWGNTSGQLQDYLAAHNLRGPNCAVAAGPIFREPSACLELPNFLSDLVATELPAPIPETFKGTLVVQPFAAAWSSAYIPLLKRTPVAELAHGTILVYEGEFDLRQVAAIRHVTRGMRLMQSDPAAAEQELSLAVTNCAESECGPAHAFQSMLKKK